MNLLGMAISQEKEKLFRVLDSICIVITKWKDKDTCSIAENVSSITCLLTDCCVSAASLSERQKSCFVHNSKVFCLSSVFVQGCILFMEHVVQEWNKCSTVEFNNFLPVAQVKQFSVLVFFIIKFGLCRHLEFPAVICAVDVVHSKPPCSIPDLMMTCRTIFKCCNNPAVKSIFIGKHLCDILGSLIQLAYSRNCRQLLSKDERKLCLSWLTQVVTQWTLLSVVARNLIILQGSSARPSPPWLSKACGMLLSKSLLLNGGVSAVILACTQTLNEEVSDWKKADIISNIVSVPPSSVSNVESYIKNISAQFLSLIQNSVNKPGLQLFEHILVCSILALYKKHPCLVQRHFFSQLLSPLDLCCAGTDEIASDSPVHIATSIEALHKLAIPFQHPCKDFFVSGVVIPLLKVVFEVYCYTQNTVSHLQALAKDIIVKSFTCSRLDVGCSILLCISNVGIVDKVKHIKNTKPGLVFQLNGDGIVEASQNSNQNTSEAIIAFQDKCVQGTVQILKETKNAQLLVQFFLSLLKYLGRKSSCTVENKSYTSLSTPDEQTAMFLNDGESELIAYALLQAILEFCDPAELFIEVNQICHFVKTILERFVDGMLNETSHQTLRFCCAALGLCLLNEGNANNTPMAELVPLLQTVSKLDSLDSFEKGMLSDVAVAIATHGTTPLDFSLFSSAFHQNAEGFNEQKSDSGVTADNKTSVVHDGQAGKSADSHTRCHTSASGCRPLIEELSADGVKLEGVGDSGGKAKVEVISEPDHSSTVESLMDDMYDTSPPNRAAACRYLTELIKARDPKTLAKSRKLYHAFLECLAKEQESFVYLSLVQGLAEIVSSEILHQSDVDSLIGHLLMDYEKYLHSVCDDNDIKKTIKLGEVIVRFTQKLGDLAPYYGPKLIGLFLHGASDKHPLIRASCISNLSELCSLIQKYIPTLQHELSHCLCSVATTDSDVVARQAATHALKCFVLSFGKNILHLFSESIKDIYKVLKLVYDKDTDGKVKLHAQLALEQLDVVMRDVLFNEPLHRSRYPEKSIVVLPNT